MFAWLRRALSPKQPAIRALPLEASLFEGESEPLYRALADHWASSDPDYAVASDAALRVAEIEQRYSLRIPDDFREYLLRASPREYYWDFQGTQWWPVAEIKNIPDECSDAEIGRSNSEIAAERGQYLVFCDFLIWCYAWAICCSEGPNRGRVALIGGIPDDFVADSFREFLMLELTDARGIHQGASN